MWYKKLAENSLSIQVLSYTDDNILKVNINGQIYEYYNISPYFKNRLEKILHVKNHSASIKMLRNIKD